jgi:tRNA dimethylallyltransferase
VWQGLYVIAGPTGVGKTRYALGVAQRLQTEIISADSMQIYKYLNIGTAKPTKDECHGITYHLIDFLDPKEGSFSLAAYIKLATGQIARLHQNGKVPLIVGGTGLYIEALLEGIFEGPGKDEAIRSHLESILQQEGISVLHEKLKNVDAETARRLHPHDRVRIIRALEVFELTGRPISELQRASRSRGGKYPYRMVVLTRERDDLYAHIEQRVEEMFARGFIDEVRTLKNESYAACIRSMQALGYCQVLEYLEGKRTLDDTKAEIKKLTRNYAKRQLTWFRHMKKAHWLNITGKGDADIVAAIYSALTEEASCNQIS